MTRDKGENEMPYELLPAQDDKLLFFHLEGAGGSNACRKHVRLGCSCRKAVEVRQGQQAPASNAKERQDGAMSENNALNTRKVRKFQ